MKISRGRPTFMKSLKRYPQVSVLLSGSGHLFQCTLQFKYTKVLSSHTSIMAALYGMAWLNGLVGNCHKIATIPVSKSQKWAEVQRGTTNVPMACYDLRKCRTTRQFSPRRLWKKKSTSEVLGFQTCNYNNLQNNQHYGPPRAIRKKNIFFVICQSSVSVKRLI